MWSRWLPALVLLAVMAATLTGFGITRHTVRNEEQHLLTERSTEVGAILSTSSMLAASLQLIGEAYAADPSGQSFSATAGTLISAQVTTVGVAELVGDQAIARAVEGTGASVGSPIAGKTGELIRNASEVDGLTSMLLPGDDVRTLVVALGRPDNTVVFQESLIGVDPITVTEDSPFYELDAALYRATSADSDDLLLATTGDLPLDGHVHDELLNFGSEQWLLQTSAREPLTSPTARMLPWILLAVGSATAVLAAGIVLVLVRRRRYALDLVEQRTLELRSAMRQIEIARAEADAANMAKNKFLSRMSHELRTPLHAVLGFAQLLERDDRPEDEQDAIEHILKGGNHLLMLINEVLDIARIESGDLAMSTEPVLAEELIAETLDLMRPLAGARSIKLYPHANSDSAHYVFADRQRLKQILLNLVSNAIKYNRIGGSVTISCERHSATELRLNVTDTGPGISTDDMALLFVAFERLGADRTDVEGSGIGLALSRRLAEAMGGTLQVTSQPGVGSTFSVQLPLVEGNVERYERLARATITEQHETVGDQKAKVLYIEDNLTNVTLLQRVFATRTDLEIIPAMHGTLGLELARQHRPAIILLDLHLPDVHGDEILQSLREDPTTSDIPVVVVSADATSGQIQRLISAGAVGYLTKPFDVTQVRQLVNDAVAQRYAVQSATR